MTVAEAATPGDDDRSQWQYATREGRVLVSQNQIDFRRLHAAFAREGQRHGGMIIVPQTVPLERLECRVRLLIDWVATFPAHDSTLFAWTDLQQRLIHGFRLPGWSEAAVRDAIGWK